jgi:hypothetical protein
MMAPAILVAAALTLAGCGGDGSSTTSTSSSSSTSSGGSSTSGGTSTAGVLCSEKGSYTGSYGGSGTLTANWTWSCSDTARSLSSNGLPNHAVGTFPNADNGNNYIKEVNFNKSFSISPSQATSNSAAGPMLAVGYTLSGAKFDPVTNGHCPSTATSTAGCNPDGGTGSLLEAIQPTQIFSFGTDSNNAHVQPNGSYHYHGMPEALLTDAAVSEANPKMLLVGWASDGYPIYARYCYTTASDSTSGLKKCTGSFKIDTVADSGRASTDWAPLGTFAEDYSYSAGSGDLDECNGRTGVTPEFPKGIYYYMITDTYPYIGRCLKGKLQP